MPLPGSLASINKAAVAAAKNGQHKKALKLYDELFVQVAKQHVTHPELFVAYANRAASHLAVCQHAEALQDSQQCMSLLKAAASSAGLLSCSRHPYWPKACQRLGDALLGLGQHIQAISAYEAGLSADPLNANLKAGLQQAQQGRVQDLLAGKTVNHLALPAPPTPERITLSPHNPSRAVLQALTCPDGSAANAANGRFQAPNLGPGRKYLTGWELPAEQVARAAEAGELSATESGDVRDLSDAQRDRGGGVASWRLPKVLLTPETASADAGLTDVYEFMKTQCDVQLPKVYLHRQLPDSPRLMAWWRATSAAVNAVVLSGRTCRVLLLGAKAGVLAAAALRAGAAHVTCVETCPYLAAACKDVLLANGLSRSSFHVTTKHPTALKLGTDLPMVCNLLIADIIDDGVLSGGFVPAVAHALDELLVREDPVLVPAAVSVAAQAVGVRVSGCLVDDGETSSNSSKEGNGKWIDLSAMDQYRWTPSQALPAPLDPSTFTPLSDPLAVWHMPALAVTADVSGVKVLDVELRKDGLWCGVMFWAELQLFGDITYTTAGPWRATSNSTSAVAASNARDHCYQASQQPGVCWLEGEVPVRSGEVYPLVATHNTVRLSFTLQEGDYARLFNKDPTFPHGQFAMAADQPRLTAYYKALKAALGRAAAGKQQQQQHKDDKEYEGPAVGQQQLTKTVTEVTVLDVGCGCGVLPLLATAAAEQLSATHSVAVNTDIAAAKHDNGHAGNDLMPSEHTKEANCASRRLATGVAASVVAADFVAPVAAAALRNIAANGHSSSVSVIHADAAMLQCGVHVPVTGVDVVVLDVFDSGLIGHQVLPLIETVKAKLLADGGQVVPASATLYMMGVEVTTNTCMISSHSAADMELRTTVQDVALNLSALERFRWSGEAETVMLSHLPHKQLTSPVKLFDLDFCQPVGTAYMTEASVELDVIAAGRMNAVVVWFDLHLAEGVSVTSAPRGFTTGGRSSNANRGSSNGAMSTPGDGKCTSEGGQRLEAVQSAGPCSDDGSDCRAIILHPNSQKLLEERQEEQREVEEQQSGSFFECHHWGQSLHYLDEVAVVRESDTLQMHVNREGSKLLWQCLGGTRHQATMQTAPQSAAASEAEGRTTNEDHATQSNTSTEKLLGPATSSLNSGTNHTENLMGDTSLALYPAPRPPWLKPGAGIEDPAVWSVKKCQQLLGQMLQRAPGGKFPPIYKDMELMQVHAGSLGLDAAVVCAVTQQLTMQEALAVAAQRQVAVSLVSSADAAGLKPPVVWK